MGMIPVRLLIFAVVHASFAAGFEPNQRWLADVHLKQIHLPHTKDVMFSPFQQSPARHRTVRQGQVNLKVSEEFGNSGKDLKTRTRDQRGSSEDGERLHAYVNPVISNELSNSRNDERRVVYPQNQFTSDALGTASSKASTVADEEYRRHFSSSCCTVTFVEPLSQAVTRLNGNTKNFYWNQITRSKINVESFYISNVHTTVFIEPVFYDSRFLAKRKASPTPAVLMESEGISTFTRTPESDSKASEKKMHGTAPKTTNLYDGQTLFSSMLQPSISSPETQTTFQPQSTVDTLSLKEFDTKSVESLEDGLSAYDYDSAGPKTVRTLLKSGTGASLSLPRQETIPDLSIQETLHNEPISFLQSDDTEVNRVDLNSEFPHTTPQIQGHGELSTRASPDASKREAVEGKGRHETTSVGSGRSRSDSHEADRIILSLSSRDLEDEIPITTAFKKGRKGVKGKVKPSKPLIKQTVEMPLVVVIERLRELYVNLAQTLKYLVGKSDFKFNSSAAQAERCWREISEDWHLDRPSQLRTDLKDTLGQYMLVSSLSECYDTVLGIINSSPEEDNWKILPSLEESGALLALARQLRVPLARLVFEEQKLYRLTPHQMDMHRRAKAGLPHSNAARGRAMLALATLAQSLGDFASSLVWLSYAGEFTDDDDIDFQKAVDRAILQHDHALANGDVHNTLTVPEGSGQATVDHQRFHNSSDGCLSRLHQSDGLDQQRVCWYARKLPLFYIPPLKVELVSYNPFVVIYHDVVPHADCVANALLARQKEQGRRLYAPVYHNLHAEYSFFGQLRNENPVMSPELAARLDTLSRGALNMKDLQFEMVLPGFRRSVPVDVLAKNEADGLASQGPSQTSQTAAYSWTIFLSSSTGGGTVFNKLNTTVFPRKGSALQVQVLRDDGTLESKTHHTTCPVVEGDQSVLQLKESSLHKIHVHPSEFTRAETTKSNLHNTETITPTSTTISTGVTAALSTASAITRTITPASFWNLENLLTTYTTPLYQSSKPYRGAAISSQREKFSTPTEKSEYRTEPPFGIRTVRIIATSTAYVTERNDTTVKTSTTYTKNGPRQIDSTVADVNMLPRKVAQIKRANLEAEIHKLSNPSESPKEKPFLVTFYETRTAYWTPSTIIKEHPVTATGDRLEEVPEHLEDAYLAPHGVVPEEEECHDEAIGPYKLDTTLQTPSYGYAPTEMAGDVEISRDEIRISEARVNETGDALDKKSEPVGQICFELPKFSSTDSLLDWACDAREKLRNRGPSFNN